jgi:hypothetical protein
MRNSATPRDIQRCPNFAAYRRAERQKTAKIPSLSAQRESCTRRSISSLRSYGDARPQASPRPTWPLWLSLRPVLDSIAKRDNAAHPADWCAEL